MQRSTYTSPTDHVHHDPIFSDIRTGAITEFQLRGGFLGTRIFPEKEQEMASEIFLQKSTVILDI